LETYLKSDAGKSCPICRAPVDINHPPPPAATAPGHHRGHGHNTSGGGNWGTSSSDTSRRPCSETFDSDTAATSSIPIHTTSLNRELLYRATRMRVLYPIVMTSELLQTVNDNVNR